jgi:hypothetical protein
MSVGTASHRILGEKADDGRGFERAVVSLTEWRSRRTLGQDDWREQIRIRPHLYGDWRTGRAAHAEAQYRATPATAAVFARLASEWRRETRLSSSQATSWIHPAYQQVIGLGPPVVPLLIEDMEAGNEDWHWALAAITRANPASAAQSLVEATEAWIAWWKRRGLPDAR